ncbi:MAG: alkaline shock response membrane anchor protein AmaP [bacterium]|nr:alkaline shock response membrane anchor protein AmaP [bacterium]
MSIFERILLSLLAVIIAAASIGTILIVAGLDIDLSSFFANFKAWQIIVVASFVFVLSVRVLFSGVRRRRPSKEAIVTSTENGEVKIAVSALRNLIHRTAIGVRGVKDAKIKITLEDDGVNVVAQISTIADCSIPVLTATLQDSIKKMVESSTGIGLKSLKLMVVDIAPSSRHRVQ